MQTSPLSSLAQVAATSVLAKANRQPELALDLITKSLQGLDTATAQAPSTQVAPSVSGTGQIIDTYA